VSLLAVLVAGLVLFAGSLAIHVLVWRVRRPASYAAWVPLLFVIFGPIATALAWFLVPWPAELAAVLLLHYALATVYTIGYTLISAFSPSVELLKLVDRSGGRLPLSELNLPFLAGELTGDRVKNLEEARLVVIEGGRLSLADKGRRIAAPVLLYRHLVGLRVGGGG
jgi:hypothetical protein